MGWPGSSCSQVLATCSFQVTLLQVNASFLVVNASATEASLRRLHHDGQGLRRPPSAQDPKAVGGLSSCPPGRRGRWLLGSPAPARRRQGVWERSLSEQGGLATYGHPRPDRKAASAQSRDRDGLPSSGSRAAPRGHVGGRGRCSACFRTAPKGWEELRALSSQTAPLWLSL